MRPILRLVPALAALALLGAPAFAQGIPADQSCGGLLCDMGVLGHKVAPTPAPVTPVPATPMPAAAPAPIAEAPAIAAPRRKPRVARKTLRPAPAPVQPAAAPVPVTIPFVAPPPTPIAAEPPPPPEAPPPIRSFTFQSVDPRFQFGD